MCQRIKAMNYSGILILSKVVTVVVLAIVVPPIYLIYRIDESEVL